MAFPEVYPLHGGQLRQIAERFGIERSRLLDFSANINPSGPPASVLSRLHQSLEDPATLVEYPDLQQHDLKRALARHVGTCEENLIVGNGFVPLLEATLRILKLRSCLLALPAFVEYRKALERAGVEVVPYNFDSNSNFNYSPDFVLAGRAEAVLIANPQNPSGICQDRALMRDLVAKASEDKRCVLLDEAFIDYMPENSLTTMVDQFANLIIFRSLTKFHAIPGLRVAYAVTNSTFAAAIEETLPPWPITTLASLAAIAALDDQAYAARSLLENSARREILQRDLELAGLTVYMSAANFILFRLPQEIDPDAFWQRMIVGHGIVLRACANYEGLPSRHFRAAIRTEMDNKRLSTAITTTMSELQSIS